MYWLGLSLRVAGRKRALPWVTYLFKSRGISQDALEQKYGDKIKRKLEKEGFTDFSEFKKQLKKNEGVNNSIPHHAPESSLKPDANLSGRESLKSIQTKRRDGSPVLPLSSILNFQKLLSTPHTSQQIASIWNVHHASKPGQLSAIIQADKYHSLMESAKRFPTFILPLPKDQPDSLGAPAEIEGQTRPHEFYFLEWSLYGRPLDPRDVPSFPLDIPPNLSANRTPNPPTSVLLFTPLGEYKLHNSFATPHLTLTNYTDLVQSHGIVLLKGEITPSENDPTRLRMKGVEAQLLALAMQKFYLKEGSERGSEILATFHERPNDFRWEDVIQICDFKGVA